MNNYKLHLPFKEQIWVKLYKIEIRKWSQKGTFEGVSRSHSPPPIPLCHPGGSGIHATALVLMLVRCTKLLEEVVAGWIIPRSVMPNVIVINDVVIVRPFSGYLELIDFLSGRAPVISYFSCCFVLMLSQLIVFGHTVHKLLFVISSPFLYMSMASNILFGVLPLILNSLGIYLWRDPFFMMFSLFLFLRT